MNKIILTFDYEIYFDGGNQYHKLIENTAGILRVADSCGVKLVFFVDVLYMVKLEELRQMDAFNLLKQQVRTLLDWGHEIQFHYHPHWINAKYVSESNTWLFDKTEYSFSDIIEKYGIKQATSGFNSATAKFREYFGNVFNTFRAGGLSINKNQDELINTLLENGFKYDSSVMPGLKMKGKYLVNDHSLSPGKTSWSIDADKGFFEESFSGKPKLTEIPVMTIKRENISFLKRVVTSLKYRLSGLFAGQAKDLQHQFGKPIDLEIRESVYPVTITFDKSNSRDIILLKHYTSEYLKAENHIMCILSHPKSYLGQSYSVFEQYLKWVKNSNNDILFVGFNDLN